MIKLKNKLSNWEVQPPQNAWNRLSSELEKDPEYLLSQKLYTYEQTPSFDNWNRINDNLDKNTATTVLPFFQRYKKAAIYSGAAAALIIFAFFTILYFNQQTGTKKFVTQQGMEIAKAPVNKPIEREDTQAIYSVEHPSEVQSLQIKSSKKYKNKGEVFNQNETPALATLSPFTSNNLEVIIPNKESIVDISNINRYVIFSNNSGDVIKLSKKVYSTISCSEFIEEELCQQKIKMLQQKAALSTMTASADFSGVLEIISNIQE